jgi:hypothetical protein
MVDRSWQALAPACRRADLSLAALFIRYVALGGLASASQVNDHVQAGGPLAAREHDLTAQAINERFLELRSAERLPYIVDVAPG